MGNKKKDKKAAAAAAAAKKAAKTAGEPAAPAEEEAAPVVLDGGELGFFQRTGDGAQKRMVADMTIDIPNIELYAGGTPLLHLAHLRIIYGGKYGLVGRNGVGKTSLLRALASGEIQLPGFINMVHVEQECDGDDRSALESVLQADREREYLLRLERIMNEEGPNGEEPPEEVDGVGLQEVYERLEEMDSDNAVVHAARLLSGLGFDTEMQQLPTKARPLAGSCSLWVAGLLWWLADARESRDGAVRAAGFVTAR